jgi:hypothetical protein
MYETLMTCLTILPGGEAVGCTGLTAVAVEHVHRLGHSEYRVREASARELIRVGLPAVGLLRAGSANPDAERANRCKDVLARIEAADREAKLARLVTDFTAPPPGGLPLLTEFLKVAGDGRDARRLYARLYREHGPALVSLQANPASMAALEQACDKLQRRAHPNPRALDGPEFAGVCFLASRAAPEGVPDEVEDGLRRAFWSRGAVELLRESKPASPLRRLFLAVLERHPNRALTSWGIPRLIEESRMRDAVPTLIRVACDPDTKYGKVYALALLPYLGAVEAAPALRAHPALFEDKSEHAVTQFTVDSGLPPVRIQSRDVALGVCAELEGRNLVDLGFMPGVRAIWGPQPNPSKYAFLDEASRAAAFERWKKMPPPGPK